ncbi:hypothetical protein [Halomonas sp.]|uniref:hypothetical protein n=1 Tax=Halomonas sp. TaxID=1486246 RepID=UPI003565C7E1
MTDSTLTEETDEQTDTPNISKLREMALRGDQYRDVIEDFTYYGMTGDLYVRPLTDPEFLPIAAMLEQRLDMDPEEAQDALEEEKDPDTGKIDASAFDREFVVIMAEAAVMGIDYTQGIAEGETKEGMREIFGIAGEDDDEGIGLQGGKTLVIAERVLSISSDADSAKSFRRDGSGK